MERKAIILGFMIALGSTLDFNAVQGPLMRLTVNNELVENLKTDNFNDSDKQLIKKFISGAINGKFSLLRCDVVPSANDGSKFVEVVQIFDGTGGTFDLLLFKDVIPAIDKVIDIRTFIENMDDNKFKKEAEEYLNSNNEDVDQDITEKWNELEQVIIDKAVEKNSKLIGEIKDGKDPQSVLINVNTLMSKVGLYVYDQLNKRKDNAVIKAYRKALKKISE